MESFTAIEKINSTQNLTVKDFEEGSINLDDVMEEVNYLKKQVSIWLMGLIWNNRLTNAIHRLH